MKEMRDKEAHRKIINNFLDNDLLYFQAFFRYLLLYPVTFSAELFIQSTDCSHLI